MSALALTTFADDFFLFLDHMDPARVNWDQVRESIADRMTQLANDLQEARESLAWDKVEVAARAQLEETLHTLTTSLAEYRDTCRAAGSEQWRNVHSQLMQRYAELSALMEEAQVGARKVIAARKLTPVNYGRNIVHICNGTFGVLIYHYLLTRGQAIALLTAIVGLFTFLEVSRRIWPKMNDFLMNTLKLRGIARPHEHQKVNSATYYTYGLLAALVCFPQQAVEAAGLALALGDPAAAVLGRRYGRRKIYQNRSYVGTTAYFVAAFLAVVIFQWVGYRGQSMGLTLALGVVAGLTAAVVELFSQRWDDNLTVPLGTAAVLSLLLWAI